MGFVLLAGLSGLAALAALAVAVRARLRGRTELVVAATLLWNAIIVLPIYVLGLTNRLYPRSLAIASAGTSALVLALSTFGISPAYLFRRVGAAVADFLRLPAEALVVTARARSLVVLGVAFTAGLLPYLAICAYLGQQYPHWDPLWYHDPMVGFTIQNHGFAMVDLPPTMQKVNGYVRLGEMTQLWLVIFADRRLADIANLLFAPAIAGSVYLLVRRYASQVLAIGWGVSVVLMPACANLLHGTFVDPQNAALLLGGIVFGTIERPRLRDGWLAALGLALAIGSKGLSLVPVPVVGLIAALLLLRAHATHRRGEAILTVAGGFLLILGTALVTYLRNYFWFHSPFWPDMKVSLPALGIDWPGYAGWSQDPGRGGPAIDVNEPFSSLLHHLFALPWTIKGMNFDQTVDYGVGVVWMALPLGAVAFVACLVAAARRRRRTPILLAVILASMVAGSPALWGPRYHIAAVGLLFVLCAWLTARAPWDRLGESAVSFVVVTSLIMFWWTPTQLRWWFTPTELARLASLPPLVREVDRDMRAPTTLVAGLAREKELGPDTLLVFNERYSAFPSLFWNNTFSNRVEYLKGGPDFLARATKAGATWVFLNDQDIQAPAARAGKSGWQEVGVLNAINGGRVYRRLPPPAPPPAPGKIAGGGARAPGFALKPW